MLKGVIFDFDGTLFDSMSIWEVSGKEFLRSVGKEARPDLREKLKRLSIIESAKLLKREYGLEQSIQEIIDGVNGIVLDFYLSEAQPKPGMNEMLEWLKSRGIKACIATATDRYMIEEALEKNGISDLFCGIVTVTEVGRGKQFGDIFYKALEVLGTEKSETIVAEDAFHAAETAKREGFTVVAIRDEYEPQTEDMKEFADLYLQDWSDLTELKKLAEKM